MEVIRLRCAVYLKMQNCSKIYQTQFLVYISLPNPLPNRTLISLLKTYFVITYRTQKIPDPHFQKQIVNESPKWHYSIDPTLIDWVFFNAPTGREVQMHFISRKWFSHRPIIHESLFFGNVKFIRTKKRYRKPKHNSITGYKSIIPHPTH